MAPRPRHRARQLGRRPSGTAAGPAGRDAGHAPRGAVRHAHDDPVRRQTHRVIRYREPVTPDDMRAELALRFAATTGDLPLRLPPALRESIVVAGLLDGQMPDVLTGYYTERLPAERAE